MRLPAQRLGTLPLHRGLFEPAERLLLTTPDIEVTTFRYPCGVEALRLVTARIEVVVLPFRGQQVWRYRVDGEDLTMRTHFDEPAASTVFGETYGGFLLHCGLSGIGAPGPHDTHPHHGELPNARYDEASLEFGQLDGADVVHLTGVHRLRVSHAVDVEFQPRLTVSSATTALEVEVELRNRRSNPFEFSYLCHVNWALPATARLVQPVPADSDHFELAAHPHQDAATAQYTARIEADPTAGDLLDGRPVQPEYCAILKPVPDEDGWAHFLMARADGRAASVSYDTAELPYAIRWISNTGDEQAAGFCLPATAHHRGRSAAQADGMLRLLAGRSALTMRVRLDLLGQDATATRLTAIADALR